MPLQVVIARQSEKNAHDCLTSLVAWQAGALVHQQDDDTYYACIDFEDGENTYDVDFYVNVTPEGSTITEHYLHKVNGEVVEEGEAVEVE